jgi:hypothetical protein
MTARPLHLPVHIRPVSWTQIEFGLLAALCVGGYASALALALSGF